MEVCVDSVESTINAQKGGAKRVELCGNLAEGGTTPTLGMLQVIKEHTDIPVFVMVRPRGGDFLYSDLEFDVMKADLNLLKQNGANGFVFGCLKRDGTIDTERCSELVEMARPFPATFHRAIDMTRDVEEALETVIALGFQRVLTSGGESTALEGVPMIRQLVALARSRIIVVPGGGITDRNVERILSSTGAKEFHASARKSVDSRMDYRNASVGMGLTLSPPEYVNKVTDVVRVSAIVSMARTFTADYD